MTLTLGANTTTRVTLTVNWHRRKYIRNK